MVFFERLRKRLQRRRMERKLLALGRSDSRRSEPEDLLASRRHIKPLTSGRATVLSVESSSRTEVSHGPCEAASSMETTLLRHVAAYNMQSLPDVQLEQHILWELQDSVPAIWPLVRNWMDWHRRRQQVVLRSTRDVSRWMSFQEKADAELFLIYDHLMIKVATLQQHHPLKADRIHTSILREVSPQAQIALVMVCVTLVAGVYGLLVLAVILKYQKRI